MIERPRNFMNKYEKNTIKKEQGITLISLTVTIIVMIILAGATISLVTGDNGMVAKAKEIKANIEKAQQEGQNRIDSLKGTTIANDGTTILNDEDAPTINSMDVTYVTDTSFKVSVNVTETGSGLAKIEYSIDGGEHFTTPKYDNRAKSYTFDDISLGFEEYNVVVKATDVEGNSSSATKKVEKLKIGDYVNYTYDEAPNYVLEKATCGSTKNPTDGVPQTTGLKWRIFNIDNTNKKIELVSEKATNDNVYFGNAVGYNNAVYFMNDICKKQYSNSRLGVTARSINLVNMERHLTANGFEKRNTYVYESEGAKYGETITFTDGASYYPKIYATQKGAGIGSSEVTQPNIVNTIDPYDGSAEVYSVPTTETYTQADNSSLTITMNYYGIEINEENYGAAAEIINCGVEYWLATRTVVSHKDRADFDLLNYSTRTFGTCMMSSQLYTDDDGKFLRPVVTISSNMIDMIKADGAWNLK